MIGQAMELHRAARDNRFYLTAQADKLPLYERFGFVAYGAEFLDGGIPHLAMKNY
jgi:predicted GNAT family N-acyltransferase